MRADLLGAVASNLEQVGEGLEGAGDIVIAHHGRLLGATYHRLAALHGQAWRSRDAAVTIA